jgi:hypothetical protein
MSTPSKDPRDLYKSIVLRRNLPREYRKDRDSGFARLLASVGECYNNAGGLFGKHNFYGETYVEAQFDTLAMESHPLLAIGDISWTSVLKGTAGTTFTYLVRDGVGSSVEVRDDQWFNVDTLTWEDRPGNVGALIGQPLGAETITIQDLEDEIIAVSILVEFETRDVTHAAELIESNDGSGVGVFVATGQDRSAVDQARDSMFVDTSEGRYLTAIGENNGVVRPPQSPFDDQLYRKITQILSWLPKTPMLVPYRLAEAIFGTQEQLGTNAWQFYEVNPNEIIFECPGELLSANNEIASYLHGWAGKTEVVAGPTNTITAKGTDARLAVASSNLNGRSLYLYYSSAWNTYSITSASYNVGTTLNTFILNAATVPSGNGFPLYIDIPGVNSFRGDVMLPSAALIAGTPNPPSMDLVYLFGKGLLDIFEFYMVEFVRAAGVSLRTEIL